MRSHDVRATTAGVLFIAATATSLAATALLGSLLNGPGFLAAVALHQDRLGETAGAHRPLLSGHADGTMGAGNGW